MKPLPSDDGTRALKLFIPWTGAAHVGLIWKDLGPDRKEEVTETLATDTTVRLDPTQTDGQRGSEITPYMQGMYDGFRLFSNQAIAGFS